MANPSDRIVPLDQLDDYRVAEGDPDVRGWEVISADGRRIGEVDGLLVDTEAMKVRYLDVEVDSSIDGQSNRHILVPIGYARLDESEDQVRVDNIDSSRLSEIPEYSAGSLTREYETDLQNRFAGGFIGSQGTEADNDFYAHDMYSDERFYGSRGLEQDERRLTRSEEELEIDTEEVRAGEVEIDKHVETDHVRRDVPLRHEEVVVERRPATERFGAESSIGEDEEVHIPVKEERLDVKKRVVPKEEIVVRKRERMDQETVEADLRREEIDIHREGDVDLEDR